MKRSRLWNQEFTIRTPVVRDGKVIGTTGVPLERPQRNVESQPAVVDRSDVVETVGTIMRAKGKGKEKETDAEKAGSVLGKRKENTALESFTEGTSETNGTVDAYVAQVLEVVPDVQPEHVRSLLFDFAPTEGRDAVYAVVSFLLDEPYPTIEREKGKTSQGSEYLSTDYASKDRPFTGGQFYTRLAQNQLQSDFPQVPSHHINRFFGKNNRLYAPTYLALLNSLSMGRLQAEKKLRTSGASMKYDLYDGEFERERAWLLVALRVGMDDFSPEREKKENVECGCCFDSIDSGSEVFCSGGHVFCKECLSKYTEGKIVTGDVNIVCMDQGGCKLSFTDAVILSCLNSKTSELYMRVKQISEINSAGIEGLKSCPFCDFKAIVDDADEELFWCGNEKCGAATCRKCKKENHIPKTCDEVKMEENDRLFVEEAMTDALRRNCPGCGKSFMKEGGCNKMTCQDCGTVSCYICRKQIQDYYHFSWESPDFRNGQPSSSKQQCLLFDPVEERHDEEVELARLKALEKIKERRLQRKFVDL